MEGGRKLGLALLLLLAIIGLGRAHVSLTFPPARYPALDFLDNSRTKPPCGVPKPPADKRKQLLYSTIFLNISFMTFFTSFLVGMTFIRLSCAKASALLKLSTFLHKLNFIQSIPHFRLRNKMRSMLCNRRFLIKNIKILSSQRRQIFFR